MLVGGKMGRRLPCEAFWLENCTELLEGLGVVSACGY